MKIILVGSTGTIGKYICEKLSSEHEIIETSRESEVSLDMESLESIKSFFKKVGKFDALICTAGSAYFGDFGEMIEEDFKLGINSKMMGQINLVMVGKEYINSGGSFTLTTGLLSDEPNLNCVGIAMVNGAVNSFVKVASCELKNDIRINAVSPGMVEDSANVYKEFFPGFSVVSMQKVFNAYKRSVEGIVTGQIIKVHE